MLEFSVVGALTSMLVQLGKKYLPQRFTSDANVAWTVALFAVLNVVNALVFGGGEWRMALSSGIVEGLAVAGLYRGISAQSKKNSVDLTEQVDMKAVARDFGGDEDERETVVRGFGGGSK